MMAVQLREFQASHEIFIDQQIMKNIAKKFA
jgi:hypothetical protein